MENQKIKRVILDVRKREIGIEIGKNLIISDSNIIPSMLNSVKIEVIDILESVQCYLLDTDVALNLIKDCINKSKRY